MAERGEVVDLVGERIRFSRTRCAAGRTFSELAREMRMLTVVESTGPGLELRLTSTWLTARPGVNKGVNRFTELDLDLTVNAK